MIYWFQSLSLKMRFLGVLLLLFPVLVFHWLLESAPWALTQLVSLSGGTGLPDAHWWYTTGQLRDLLAAWSDQGATLYLTVLWPTQVGFVLSYALFLTAATLYLLKKANPRGPWWYLLPLLPLSGAACHVLQGLTVAAAVFWGVGDWAWAAPVFTAGQWFGALASGLALCVGGLVTLIRAVLARRSGHDYTK